MATDTTDTYQDAIDGLLKVPSHETHVAADWLEARRDGREPTFGHTNCAAELAAAQRYGLSREQQFREAEAKLGVAEAEIEALKGARLLSVLFGHHKGAPKPFALQRRNGRALVALGAEFPDGAVALRLANDGGWTTVSEGGAEQFSDASAEILWLSDELEPLVAMEAEVDAMRSVVEAAKAWRASMLIVSATGVDKRATDELRYKNRQALFDAVDALSTKDGA